MLLATSGRRPEHTAGKRIRSRDAGDPTSPDVAQCSATTLHSTICIYESSRTTSPASGWIDLRSMASSSTPADDQLRGCLSGVAILQPVRIWAAQLKGLQSPCQGRHNPECPLEQVHKLLDFLAGANPSGGRAAHRNNRYKPRCTLSGILESCFLRTAHCSNRTAFTHVCYIMLMCAFRPKGQLCWQCGLHKPNASWSTDLLLPSLCQPRIIDRGVRKGGLTKCCGIESRLPMPY